MTKVKSGGRRHAVGKQESEEEGKKEQRIGEADKRYTYSAMAAFEMV